MMYDAFCIRLIYLHEFTSQEAIVRLGVGGLGLPGVQMWVSVLLSRH